MGSVGNVFGVPPTTGEVPGSETELERQIK